jgi:hypothetical protein
VGAEQPVSQRLFDEVCKRYDDQIGQLRTDVKALKQQREDDADDRRAGVGLRIAGISAGAGVLAACVAVIELWHASGR